MGSTEHFQDREKTLCGTLPCMCVIVHSSKPVECARPGVAPDANCGLWVDFGRYEGQVQGRRVSGTALTGSGTTGEAQHGKGKAECDQAPSLPLKFAETYHCPEMGSLLKTNEKGFTRITSVLN